MKLYLFIITLLALLTSSCVRKNDIIVEPAFYDWGAGSAYFTKDDLAKLKVKKFYVKFFEVDYNYVRGNFPIAKNRPETYDSYEVETVEMIPTVFVKNEVFKHNTHQSLDELADNMVFLITKYYKDLQPQKTKILFDEIQIDCDWTKSTKDNYFYLLKKIKELSKKKISCTLRLYPYAYPDIMGVPPVDRVMLMCYNLINPLDNPDKNSILDVSELEKYIKNKKEYPLPLDVALPVFYWAQHYRNNQFSELLTLSKSEVEKFAKKTDNFWYTVTKDTVVDWDTKIRMGDRIKYENVSIEELRKAVNLIKKHVELKGKTTVSLFDLQTSVFKDYTHEELSDLYTSFAK